MNSVWKKAIANSADPERAAHYVKELGLKETSAEQARILGRFVRRLAGFELKCCGGTGMDCLTSSARAAEASAPRGRHAPRSRIRHAGAIAQLQATRDGAHRRA